MRRHIRGSGGVGGGGCVGGGGGVGGEELGALGARSDSLGLLSSAHAWWISSGTHLKHEWYLFNSAHDR